MTEFSIGVCGLVCTPNELLFSFLLRVSLVCCYYSMFLCTDACVCIYISTLYTYSVMHLVMAVTCSLVLLFDDNDSTSDNRVFNSACRGFKRKRQRPRYA